MSRYWEAEPRADISGPPGSEVLWTVRHIETNTTHVDIKGKTAYDAAKACGYNMSECTVKRASQ